MSFTIEVPPLNLGESTPIIYPELGLRYEDLGAVKDFIFGFRQLVHVTQTLRWIPAPGGMRIDPSTNLGQ